MKIKQIKDQITEKTKEIHINYGFKNGFTSFESLDNLILCNNIIYLTTKPMFFSGSQLKYWQNKIVFKHNKYQVLSKKDNTLNTLKLLSDDTDIMLAVRGNKSPYGLHYITSIDECGPLILADLSGNISSVNDKILSLYGDF